MDWARVKTILIVIFLMLNTFLLFANLYTDYDLGFQSDYARYAREYLESREIRIDAKFSDSINQMGTLIYADKDFDFNYLSRYVFGEQVNASTTGDAVVITVGTEKIELSDDELTVIDKVSNGALLYQKPNSFLKKSYSYLKEFGYSKRDLDLQFSMDTEDEIMVIFNLKYKNYVLFDKTIKISLDQEGILKVTIPASEVKRINNNRVILSAYQILVMSEIPDGLVIKSVTLGYKHIHEGELYDTPVWRVVRGDGAINFYNAYTGEEL